MGWQPGKGNGTGDDPGPFPDLPGEGTGDGDQLPGEPRRDRASWFSAGSGGRGSDRASDRPSGAGGAPGPAGAGSVSGPAEACGKQGAGRDPWLDGFEQGGAWDTCPPGPVLAAVLALAGGQEWRCPQATDDELTGILRGLAAMESWAAAGRLAVTRELIRRDDFPHSGRARHGDLPDEWSETVDRELSLAQGITVLSAGRQSFLAWDLGARLPGTAGLLADGTFSLAKARIISEAFALLSDEDAARAEAALIAQVTGKTPRTPGQLAALAARIAAQVDPGMAERRRKAAEKVARVELFREASGTAALSGRDLPPDAALAAMASVTARAGQYKESGAFGDARMDQYRATAYLDLLGGVAAWERIAYGRLAGTDTDSAPGSDDPGSDGPGRGDPGPGGPGPADYGNGGGCVPPTGKDPASDTDRGTGGVSSAGSRHPDAVDGDGGDRGGPGDSGNGPEAGSDHLDDSHTDGSPDSQTRMTDLVFPLTTLLGQASRPGESHGFGVLDPELCRNLAALAIRSPGTTVCLTVTDPDGIAVGHGCLRPARRTGVPPVSRPGEPPGPPPGGRHGQSPGGPPDAPVTLAALPARINLTITADRLTALLANPPNAPVTPGTAGRRRTSQPPRVPEARGRPDAGRTPEAPGAPGPYGWAITPHILASRDSRGRPSPPGDPGWCRFWTMAGSGGLEFTVRLEPVPTQTCDHRHESHAYQPSETLRHLVQVRDRNCTFPTCSRHARDSDFEHAVPYDKGGRTCACNAGARSRSCHKVKQTKGWMVSQPRPGTHQWKTPSGRTYAQQPYLYPV